MSWFDQWLNEFVLRMRMLCEAAPPRESRLRIVLMFCGLFWALAVWQHRRGLILPSQRDDDEVECDA